MPIYEYRCGECGKKTTIVTLSVSAAVQPVCRHCGGTRLSTMVSRVAVRCSEGSRLERLADPSSLAGLENEDPKGVARWMKNMGREMGEDLGENFDEEIDRAVEDAEREKETDGGISGGGEGDDEGF